MFKKSLLTIVATALFGFSANSFAFGIFDNIFYSSVDEIYSNTPTTSAKISKLPKTLKLTQSGMKINTATDDAPGYAISAVYR